MQNERRSSSGKWRRLVWKERRKYEAVTKKSLESKWGSKDENPTRNPEGDGFISENVISLKPLKDF